MSAIINNLAIIVYTIIGFAGLVCVIFFAIAGYRITSSGNDPQSREAGIATLKNAIIGTVIVVFSIPLGNFFISQITSGSGTAAPQLIAQRSASEIEAPTVTNVVAGNGFINIYFSEPVTVYNPEGVKIATTNVGAMHLVIQTSKAACTAQTAPGTYTATYDDNLFLCFSTPTGVDTNSQSRATQFILGRGSSIRDSDDNVAVTVFAPVPIS